MGLSPGTAPMITITVPQQEGFEPVTTAPPIVHRIAARTAQIPNRFVGRFENVDRCQFSSPQKPRQLARVAPVGFKPFSCLLWRERRCHHLTSHSQLFESPRNPKTARTRFVADLQRRLPPMRLT